MSYQTINPATEEVLKTFKEATDRELDYVIEFELVQFGAGRKTPGRDRLVEHSTFDGLGDLDWRSDRAGISRCTDARALRSGMFRP